MALFTNMSAKLTVELAACMVLYIGCLFYSFYKNYELSNESLTNYYYLDEGWTIFNQRRRDDYDWEWEHYRGFSWNHAGLFVLHAVLLETVRHARLRHISVAVALMGLAIVGYIFSPQVLLLLLLQSASFYCYNPRRWSRKMIWLKTLVWIALINYVKMQYFYDKLNPWLGINNDRLLELSIIISWNVIRCASFCLDKEDADDHSDYGFADLLGYTFYFPLLLFGPVIIYDRFKTLYTLPADAKMLHTQHRITVLVKQMIRVLFWATIMEAGQHFFYINVIQLDLDLLNTVNLWALYGLGFLMGQFFYVKYVVFYGIGIAFGTFDRVDMPGKPICIARVHLYSDMWKYFDRGLYEFLFKYIYTQLCSKASSGARKICSSLATFIFIYIWHGLFQFVLIWSTLNWICIVLERYVNSMFPASSRWRALIGTNVFIASVLSNFFFFAREQVGFVYLKRTYVESIGNYCALYAVAYCFYRTGEWVKNVQGERIKQQKSTGVRQ